MKVLGIIPARSGSKRLPRKNLRLLGGRPLTALAIESALGARSLARVVVSSDDPEVLALAGSYGANLPLPRPPELSGDRSQAIEYVVHALRTLEQSESEPFEVIAILQPSSPLRTSEDVDATVDLLERTGADTAVSVARVPHAIHPAKLKLLDGDRLIPYLEEERGRMAEHELPPVFVRNCAVYVTRRAIVDSGRIIGDDCRAFVMPAERSVDINDEMDLLFAEFCLERRSKRDADS